MLKFAHIEYLYQYGWLIGLIPLVFIFYWVMRSRKLSRIGKTELVAQLLPDKTNAKHIFKLIFVILAAVCILIGLANPEVGSNIENVKREGIDLVVAVDISRSMNTQDVKPDRMERAKQLASRLIEKLESDRIALVVFAGHAYVQMPLTIDHGAAKLYLSSISTELAGTQGTALAEAIDVGKSSFNDKSKASKVILLISDGEDHEGNALEEADKVTKDGISVYTVGVGTQKGGLIPLYQNGMMNGIQKDENGGAVVSRLDDGMLRKIAASGNGKYYTLNENNQVMDDIIKDFSKLKKSGTESKKYTDFDDQFQWLLAGALFLLFAEFLLTERRSRLFNWNPFKERTA